MAPFWALFFLFWPLLFAFGEYACGKPPIAYGGFAFYGVPISFRRLNMTPAPIPTNNKTGNLE